MIIPKRRLGKAGPAVGCLGYGAMVLEGYYGSSNDDDAVTTIHRALESGMTMIDTADAYGNGHNESLVGRAIRGRREQAFVCYQTRDSLRSGRTEARFFLSQTPISPSSLSPSSLCAFHGNGTGAKRDTCPAGAGVAPASGAGYYANPGTRRPERIEENARAAAISLDQSQLERIDKLARPGLAEGATLL